jgi:hypothetical protein
MAVTLRVQIEMQIVTRELAMQQLDTTNLNDAVAVISRETCGFGV